MSIFVTWLLSGLGFTTGVCAVLLVFRLVLIRATGSDTTQQTVLDYHRDALEQLKIRNELTRETNGILRRIANYTPDEVYLPSEWTGGSDGNGDNESTPAAGG